MPSHEPGSGPGHGHGHGPGHGHSSGHGHAVGHAAARHVRRMRLTLVLVAGFFVVELVTALLSSSLTLLSDAGHMAADVVALGAALLATRVAMRPDRTGRRTYGHYRAEVFATGLTVVIMVGVSVWVVVEAVSRIGRDTEVAAVPMLVVGALGLLVNLVSMRILHNGAQESLNVRGAYLEVMADALGSIAVIVAALLVQLTGHSWWDLVVALGLAAFILGRAWPLGRQVVRVLAQHSPDGLDEPRVNTALTQLPGVAQVHDVHLWTLTSGMNVATAHLVTTTEADPHEVLDRAGSLMRETFGIEHATLQVEPPTHRCTDLSW